MSLQARGVLGVRAALALVLVWGVLAPAVSAAAPAGSGSVVVQGSVSPCSSSAVVDQSELLLVADCAVLWGVYSGLSDRGELDDEGPLRWGSGTVLGDWLGVTVTGGRVTALELSDADVAGALPASLASLSALVTLDLSWNGFSGEIPAALGSLSSLEVLRLSSSSLSGAVPSALGSLGSLRVLDLRSNSLSGAVPSALGSLSSLEDLRLDSNNLSGSIPAELASLESLVHLDLWGNTLTGQIPAELGSLSSLETLVVAANELSGPIPAQLGMLGSLVTLDASHNALSGQIPAQLGMLGSLEKLNLDHNMLSGAIPAELGSLGSLVRMSLAANDLSGPIPAELGSLASLEILNLADNDLSGSIPAALGDLGSLVWLSVVNNDLSGLIPAELGAVASLRHLSLGANPLAWPPPESLSAPRAGLSVRLPAQWAPAAPAAVTAAAGVDRLTVTWDAPADSAPYTVASYALYWRPAGTTARFGRADTTTTSATVAGLIGGRAYELFVTAANHTGTSPASTTITATPLETPCGQSTTVDQTQALLVGDCDALWALRRAFTDATAVTTGTGAWDDTNAISTWTGVTVTNNRVTGLDLSATGVAGPVAAAVGSLTALTELDLSDNALTGDIPATVGSLTSLTELDLSDNALTGDIPATLGSLTSLTELDLSFNTLTGPIPTQLGSLSSLEVLDLVANDLTGAIPTQLGSLTALTSLRVSGDGLTGAIPTQLGSLTALTELHIDGGGLTGAVPTQLGSLTSLTTLHIGGGSLTGAIPAQLSSLTALTSLYISGSGLSGTLPPELGALTSLETLWIKSDSLTGTVPARYGGLTSLDTLYLSGGALTGPVPAWLSSLTSLKRLYLHNNALTGPVPADLADLTTVWLSGNDLRGHIPPQTATAAALATLDVRDNPLSWPAPANVTDPPARLTALLPDTDSWVPPRPGNVTADAADASVTVTWDHPGAGDHYLVDTYTVNYRPADQTGDHTQQTAAESPVTITGLTNATEYAIFVTATNTQGTSNPSLTVAATPSTTAQARTHDHTGAYSDSDDIAASAHEDAINALADWHIFDRTDCSTNPLKFCPDSDLPRWKLAVWLVRALDRLNADPDNNLDTFNDVDKKKHWYKPFVERLRVLGVTTGCVRRSTIFCPNDTVTRAEMAVFLVRAFNIPSAGDAGFTDIDRGYWAYNQINALADAGITRGCNTDPNAPLIFCPEATTTNAQMAAFIHRACTNTNPVIARDCSPTDIDNGSTGGGGGGSGGGGGGTTPQKPQAPTINAVPKYNAITVTWKPADDGPAATSWQIRYSHTVHHTLPFPRDEIIQQTHDLGQAAVPSAGVTITGLKFSTTYIIEVKALNVNVSGAWSDPEEATTQQQAVELKALEITQGLQNWNGDITLVKGKRTVVRVFLEPTSGKNTTVNVRLYAVLPDGTEHTALRLQNPDPQPTIHPGHPGTLTEFNWHLYTTEPDVISRRGQLGASANFLLALDEPSITEDWIGDPADAPTADPHRVTYRLEVDEGVTCEEAVSPANQCEADLEFVYVASPRVRMVGVDTVNGSPTADDLTEQAERIKSLMPIPDVHVEILPSGQDFPGADYPTVPSTPSILARLKKAQELYAKRDVPSYRWMRFLGVVAGEPGAMQSRGLGNVSGEEAVWFLEDASGESAVGYMRNVGVHEFGHTIGEYHASSPYRFEDGGRVFQLDTMCISKTSERFEAPDDNAVRYESDYVVRREHTANKRVEDWAALGEVDNPEMGVDVDSDVEMWGFDTRFAAPGSADWLAVLNPANTYSLMSYCNYEHLKPPYDSGDSQARWVDGFFHGRFIDDINGIDWDQMTDGGSGDGSEPASEAMVSLFAGHVTLEDTADGIAVGEAVVSPVYRYQTASPVREPAAGGYVLDLLDSGGSVVRSVPFTADAAVAEPPESGAAAAVTEIWAVPVADAPGYHSYRITRGQSQVAAVTRSAGAPTVAITAPVAGQALSGDTVQFSWSASDPDGDDLTYLVQYSTDASASYQTIALDYPSSSLSLDRALLKGSSRSRLRVIASDGTRSAAAESAVFSVAQNPPKVLVRSPATGAIYGGARTITLEASAYDTEDGTLDETAITWSSSIDGTVAAGARAVIDTSELTAGTHVLTATATDSASATAQASVTITVKTTNEPPAAADDTAHAAPGRTVLVDVTANDSDPEGDIDPHSVAVITPPALGAAAASHPAGSARTAISYTANGAAGYDAVIYEICDTARQCTTAEFTVVVDDA